MSVDKCISSVVFRNLSEGLIELQSLDAIERDHITNCTNCQRNLDFYSKRQNNFIDRIPTWQKVTLSSGYMTDRIIDALEKHFVLEVVSGELPQEIWNKRMCDAIQRFLEKGGRMRIIAGPNIVGETHPLLALIKRTGTELILYITDTRQEVHSVVADGNLLIHCEKSHQPHAEYRYCANVDSLEQSEIGVFAHMRFNTILSSVMVTPYSG